MSALSCWCRSPRSTRSVLYPGAAKLPSCCAKSMHAASRWWRRAARLQAAPDADVNLLPEKYRYIAVEGPIGAGKTSLARLLAEKSGSVALLEDPHLDPVLAGFYRD